MQIERATDCQHPLAQAQSVRATKRDRRQFLALDLDQSHVGRGVGTDNLRVENAIVVQLHTQLRRILHHVVIRYDVAVLRDDHTRATRTTLLRLHRATTLRAKEEIEEGIRLAAILHLLGLLDIDNRLHCILGGVGQVGIVLRIVCRKVRADALRRKFGRLVWSYRNVALMIVHKIG